MGIVGLILIIVGVIAIFNGSWILGLLAIILGVLLGGNDVRGRRF